MSTSKFVSRLSSQLQPIALKFNNKSIASLQSSSPLLVSVSSRRLSRSSRLPLQLSCVGSMMPLHSAIAFSRLISSLSNESDSWALVPQENSELFKHMEQTNDDNDVLVPIEFWSSDEPSIASSLQETNKKITSSPSRGLDHCITAPADTRRNLLNSDYYNIMFWRSMSEKRTSRSLATVLGWQLMQILMVL